MKRPVEILTAALLVLAAVFAAACSRGDVGSEPVAQSLLDAGESESACAAAGETAEVTAEQAACEWASDGGKTTQKPVASDPQAEQTDEDGAEPDAESTQPGKENLLNPDGEWALYVREVGDGWFKATHFGTLGVNYKVLYDHKGAFNVGDTVDATLSLDIPKGTVHDFGVIVVQGVSVKKSDVQLNPNDLYKPVIYLYPEEKTEVRVRLDYNGKLTRTIPEYGGGWNVTAYPDGSIVNGDGAKYPYLFWEGEGKAEYDLSKGFCVKGADSEKFLCEKLARMGMSQSEISDFNDFWVPHLEKNPYNRICFQTAAYTDNARLRISPEPDSVLRVFMVFTPLKAPISMEAQTFGAFERKGFTVVEWGGAVTEG